MSQPIYWCGPLASHCQISGEAYEGIMYDCYIPSVRCWGNINQATFEKEGCRLGTGLGQKYERQEDNRWLKVAG